MLHIAGIFEEWGNLVEQIFQGAEIILLYTTVVYILAKL